MRHFFTYALMAATLTAAPCAGQDTTPATSPARGGIKRTITTTPLTGEALAKEIDARFGIWLVGETLSAAATLPEQATADQAVALLRTALQRDQPGCQIQEVTGSNHKIFQITSAEHKAPPLHYGNDPDKIANTNDIITQIIPLKYLSSGNWAFDGKPLSAPGPGSGYVNDTGQSCLIVTDTSAKVRRITEAFVKMDVPQASHDRIDYRQLEHANAAAAARVLNAAFGAPATIPATGLVAIPRGFSADADARTNTVVLNGPVDQIDRAYKILDQMDAAATTTPATSTAPTSPAR